MDVAEFKGMLSGYDISSSVPDHKYCNVTLAFIISVEDVAALVEFLSDTVGVTGMSEKVGAFTIGWGVKE